MIFFPFPLFIALLLIYITYYFLFLYNPENIEQQQITKALPTPFTFSTSLLNSINLKPKQHTNNNTYNDPRAKQVILEFSQVTAHDSHIVGGKGANLAEMTQAGFPVPQGFCVTSYDPQLISQRYQQLSQQISQSQQYTPVAVRSSATAEDGSAASFAGQLETYLGVIGPEAVVEKTKLCFESLNSTRVAAYTSTLHNTEKNKCCVVIQRMVNADAAGVLFTKNPLPSAEMHNETDIIVTASYGLGEAVVADLVNPDTYTIAHKGSKDFTIKEKQLGTKKLKYILSSPDPVEVAENERNQFCLSDDVLLQLAHLGTQIEQHYGKPQDVEFAVSEGKVYILQARPITTLDRANKKQNGEKQEYVVIDENEFDSKFSSEDWITTCNAQEMFPGAGTPLTISMLSIGINLGMQLLQFRFGVRENVNPTNLIVGWQFGKFFLNMSEFLSAMATGMFFPHLAKQNGEMSILGRHNDECSIESLQKNRKISGFIKRGWNGILYGTTLLSASFRIKKMIQRIDNIKSRFAALHTGKDEPNALTIFREIENSLEESVLQWADGVTCGTSSAGFMLGVMKLLAKDESEMWTPKIVGELSAIIKSDGDSETVAESCDAVNSLDIIKHSMDAEAAEKFINMSPKEALGYLQTTTEQCGVVFREVINRHGHRCIKESEMRTLEWKENPLLLINLLQSSVRANTASAAIKTVSKSSNDILKDMLKSKAHLNLLKRIMLKVFVRLTRNGVRLRELGKSLQIKHWTVIKQAFRDISKNLHDHNVLHETDLIYFLSLKEVFVMCYLDKALASPKESRDENYSLEDFRSFVQELNNRAMTRRRLLPKQEAFLFRDLYKGPPVPRKKNQISLENANGDGGASLKGTPVSAGVAKGPARVAKTLAELEGKMNPGEVLVCPVTDVGWTPYFGLAAALVTETGGMLSHGAVVAREYGLPCVVNVQEACDRVSNGDMLEVDGDTGTVVVLGS